ncbi:MAG TPA: hypothetical protein VF145_11705 [Chitinophagaceae bacterium]
MITELKKILFTALLLLQGVISFACDACSRQQPKLLNNLTHGRSPDSNWDYVIVSVAVLIVLATLVFSIKKLVYPKEEQNNHIKRSILNL